MKAVRLFLYVALLFLAAAALSWSLPGFPGLAFAAVVATVTYAAYHDPEHSVVVGAAIGLALDLVSPEYVGANAFALALAAYGVAAISAMFHRPHGAFFFLFGLLGFALRTVLVIVFHLIADGQIIVTTQLRGFFAAMLWSAFFAMLLSPLVREAVVQAEER